MLTELRTALNNKPTYLFFTVTSRCNAFCDFCWNWRNVADAGKFSKPGAPVKRDELSLDEIERLTKKLPDMLVVNLFGGEPFLRSDLYEIMRLFIVNSRAKYISIPTNGYYSEKILEDISKISAEFPQTFFKILISIDGPGIEHDKLRKLKNGYANAIETSKKMAELRTQRKNLSLSCNINYNSITQNFIESFVKDMMDLKYYDSIYADLIRGDDLVDRSLLNVDLQKFDEIQNLLKKYNLNSNNPFSPLHKAIEQKTSDTIKKSLSRPQNRVFKCYAGKKILLLTDIGDVYACEHLLNKKMGNIRDHEYDLNALLESSTARAIRSSIEKKECNCHWECAINTSNIFDVTNYPDLIFKTIKNIAAL